jgi:hypothetical protein
MDRLEREVRAEDLIVLARIDHAAGAGEGDARFLVSRFEGRVEGSVAASWGRDFKGPETRFRYQMK